MARVKRRGQPVVSGTVHYATFCDAATPLNPTVETQDPLADCPQSDVIDRHEDSFSPQRLRLLVQRYV